MHLAAQQASERAQRLAALIVRRPWSILAVALVVGVAALWLALGLRVDQQLRALLPDDAISTTRIDAMSERLGNQSDLYVEIRSPPARPTSASASASPPSCASAPTSATSTST